MLGEDLSRTVAGKNTFRPRIVNMTLGDDRPITIRADRIVVLCPDKEEGYTNLWLEGGENPYRLKGLYSTYLRQWALALS